MCLLVVNDQDFEVLSVIGTVGKNVKGYESMFY